MMCRPRLLELVEELVEPLGVDVQMQHRSAELAEDRAAIPPGSARRGQTPHESARAGTFLVELDELALDEGTLVGCLFGAR